MSDTDRPVGARLAELRRAAGLTGHDLARRVGWSQAKISRIETTSSTGRGGHGPRTG
jgi:transcriptional regulator with XRE-family HTH domain